MRFCLAARILSATAALTALSFFGAKTAAASDRRFTYVYGSEVLAPGNVELEPWTTIRFGRDGFFIRMDHRLELEVGLTSWVQTAFYFNFKSTSLDVRKPGAPTTRETTFEWQGVSSEWKFKLADNIADPLGVGLYIEPSISPSEAELEAKVLLDKRAGDVYVAYNLIGEYDAAFDGPGQTAHELVLQNSAGAAYFFTDDVALGIEGRNESVWVVGEGLEGSTFFAGPTVSFSQKRWWAAASVLPQIASIRRKGEAKGGIQDLTHNERMNVRILFGVDL